MELMKNYFRAASPDAAMILLLGSGGNNILTKGVAKWLVRRGVNAMCLGPENSGYHSFPLESVETAIRFLKEHGSRKIGILGASITTIPALIAAARFPEISLTIAVTPCDFVLQGFSKEKRDGCTEWPVEGESMLIMLDMKGICASSGSACTSGSLDPSHVLLAIGLPHEIAHGSLRLTLGADTTKEQIDTTVDAIKEIVAHLRSMSPLYEDFVKNQQ